jgi:translation elongation factor EF-Ts
VSVADALTRAKAARDVSERLARAKELHARTGAPLGDCVQALAESWDDPDRAIGWLRVRMLCR